MKTVLIYYKGFNAIPGGSEFQPLMLISELQKHCRVTLALGWKSNIEQACKVYGVPVDTTKLDIVYTRPKNKILLRLDTILPFYRTRMLRRLAKNADICISAMNIMDFGKPAHSFICSLTDLGDVGFKDFVLHTHKKATTHLIRFVRRFIGEVILRPLLRMRSTRTILSDMREHIYTNSFYTERTMKEYFGNFNSTVFYPPTILEISKPFSTNRDRLRVNYIGRISESKDIIGIIRIVEQTRRLTNLDITLHLAGYIERTSYVETVKKVIADKHWCTLVGPVTGEAKEKFLLSGAYAIHAERDEAFGISITEYLKASIIPIVPDEGGACEIADAPDLTYHNNEEAAQILAKLIGDEAFYKRQLTHCISRAQYFSIGEYMKRQDKLINDLLNQ